MLLWGSREVILIDFIETIQTEYHIYFEFLKNCCYVASGEFRQITSCCISGSIQASGTSLVQSNLVLFYSGNVDNLFEGWRNDKPGKTIAVGEAVEEFLTSPKEVQMTRVPIRLATVMTLVAS